MDEFRRLLADQAVFADMTPDEPETKRQIRSCAKTFGSVDPGCSGLQV